MPQQVFNIFRWFSFSKKNIQLFLAFKAKLGWRDNVSDLFLLTNTNHKLTMKKCLTKSEWRCISKLAYRLQNPQANRYLKKSIKHCCPIGNQKMLTKYTLLILLSQPRFVFTVRNSLISLIHRRNILKIYKLGATLIYLSIYVNKMPIHLVTRSVL